MVDKIAIAEARYVGLSLAKLLSVRYEVSIVDIDDNKNDSFTYHLL